MVVLLNSGAGWGDAAERRLRVRQLFSDVGLAAEFIPLDQAGDVAGTIRQALHKSEDIVVAAGGDGTVNAVAAQLVDTGKTTGVLPLGTLNHFAKDLRIPLELEQAVRVLANGHTSAVDRLRPGALRVIVRRQE